MTKDDIIRMAREAGIPETATEGVFIANSDDLGRLIAAEREKVARWQIGSGYTTGHGDTIEDLLVELEWQVRESEREACAQIAFNAKTYIEAAESIRARALHDMNQAAEKNGEEL